MQERTINNTLRALYRQGGDQGQIAGTLLIARNVPIPRMGQNQPFRRGQTKAIVLASLADGPKTTGQIGCEVAKLRPALTPKQATQRAYMALERLRVSGVVVRDGRIWGLKPPMMDKVSSTRSESL